MFFQERLQEELLCQLIYAPDLNVLLNESEQMASRREDTVKMLEALVKANSVISEIREARV